MYFTKTAIWQIFCKKIQTICQIIAYDVQNVPLPWILNRYWEFFCFNILILIYFFKHETIETHARAFLPFNISAVGSVSPLDELG